MRRLLLLILFQIFASSVWARVDIILDEGVSTYLSHLVSASLNDNEELQHSYDMGSLILNNESSLYITQSSVLKAHDIQLQRQAKIHMLNGGTLKIETDIFDGGYKRVGRDSLGIVSVEQHPDIFNPSQKISSFPPPAQERIDAQFSNSNNWSVARPGVDGRKGEPGDKGAHAGNIHIESKIFYGGLFLARGGEGQKGAPGEAGGPGGSGYRFPPLVGFFPNNSMADHFPDDIHILYGANGGAPGAGGDGGFGGDGGYISINAERSESVIAGVNFIYDVVGGRGGDVGEAGSPGIAGEAGKVEFQLLLIQSQNNYTTPYQGEFLGQPGQVNTTVTSTNKSGEPGHNGTMNTEGF